MSVKAQRKSFSIERRKSGANGADGSAAFDVLAAIQELRQDIAGLASKSANGDGMSVDAEADQDLRIELAQMVRTIARAKTEIASIKHPKSEDDFMVEASNELDAVVASTEIATNTILESGEEIERLVDKVKILHADEDTIVLMADQVAAQVINIFEACNFQDVTGQRITKIIRTLRFIETRILSMIDIWGKEAFEGLPIPGPPPLHSSDEHVSGPQLENQGISQEEIDALFD